MQKNLAFIFPGQGSQKPGMLAELAGVYPVVKDTFDQASTALDYDLWELSQQGSQEAINQTERTQPLLLAASVAVWRVLEQKPDAPRPALLAGHSLGEWSALVCAGVVAFADAIHLVQQRGKLMQEAVPAGVGAMAAIIGLEDAVVVQACGSAAEGEVVAAVNFNSPGQVVIAGHAAAVQRAIEACQAAGAKRAMLLPVSAPFHTELMRPAAERLAPQIVNTEFAAPQLPVVHNVTAATESDPEQIKRLMVEQIYSPVRWVECVQALADRGVQGFAECGPGKVLCGLNRRIDKSLDTVSLETPEDIEQLLAVGN